MIVSIVVVSRYSILIFILIVLLSILSALFTSKLRKKTIEFDISNTQINRKISYYDSLFKDKKIVADSRVASYTEFLKNQYFDLLNQKKDLENKHYRKTLLLRIINLIISLTLKFSSYFSIVYMVVSKNLGVGIYYYLISIVLMMSGNVKSLISIYDNQMSSSISSSVYNKIFAYTNSIYTKDKENDCDYSRKVKIEFKNVSFAYPNTNVKVLDNVSFKVEAGESLGIVGENGAGKTTILKLLLGVYDNYDGEILINNNSLKTNSLETIGLNKLSQYFGVVFQDFNHYALSYYDNIYLGDLYSDYDLEKMDLLIKESGLDSKVEKSYDKGYSELTKILSKKSEELSIGEWQKLAFVRALYRNSGIIVLDEPVASLDVAAEKKIFDIINSLDKTRIVISHRLADMIKMDKIIVIIGGKIVATGNHKHLMECNSYYREMFELQAKKYK